MNWVVPVGIALAAIGFARVVWVIERARRSAVIRLRAYAARVRARAKEREDGLRLRALAEESERQSVPESNREIARGLREIAQALRSRSVATLASGCDELALSAREVSRARAKKIN